MNPDRQVLSPTLLEPGVSQSTDGVAPSQPSRPGSLIFNSFSWVGARALSGLARTGILLGIARHYGPFDFGEIALAISLTEIFRTITECGLDTIAIRRFRLAPENEKPNLLGDFLGIKLLIASAGYVLALLALAVVANTRREILLGAVAGLSLFSANLLGAFSSYFQSNFSMLRVLSTTVRSVVVLITLSFVLVALGWPLFAVIGAIPLAEALNVALLWRSCHERIRLRLDPAQAFDLLRQSFPAGLMGAMVILYFRLDNLLIFRFCGAAALGIYATASRIVEPLLMVPHSFSTTLYSLLSSQDEPQVVSAIPLQSIFRTMWPAYVFSLTAAGALLFAGNPVLARFLPQFSSASPILKLFLLVLLVRTVNVTLTAMLCSQGRYSTLARITGLNLAANIVFALLLIPRYGPWGAAVAVLLTESFNMAAQWRANVQSRAPRGLPTMARAEGS